MFVAGTPTLTISSVAGISAPASPTGNADITLASNTPNPVTVVFTTTGVPVGNTVQLTLTPAFGSRSSVISPALTGSTASATASVQITLPVGPSVLSAQTTFTIVAALGDLLRNFAGNERVEKVTLDSDDAPLENEGRSRLASSQAALDRCAAGAVRTGRLVMSFSVHDGRVREPQVIMDSLRDEKIAGCVARAISGTELAGTGHGTASLTVQ